MFPTRSHTNWAVQSQKMLRGLKSRFKVEGVLYYPCSESKGTDQLRGHREADLRLLTWFTVHGSKFNIGISYYNGAICSAKQTKNISLGFFSEKGECI